MRRNVIVLVDEAHRTQEGDLGTAMRDVLKEASLFGFTGTPIELGDHNTPRAFGRELSTDDTGVTRFERYLEPRYSIDGGDHRIRTDVLLFVNGIPVVNIEAKTTARDWHNDWTEGARQCGR